MRRRGCNNALCIIVAGATVIVGIILLFLIPAVVWLVMLGLLGGMGLMCLLRTCRW